MWARLRRWRAAVPSARRRGRNRSARWSGSPPWRPDNPHRSSVQSELIINQLNVLWRQRVDTKTHRTHTGPGTDTENFLSPRRVSCSPSRPLNRPTVVLLRATLPRWSLPRERVTGFRKCHCTRLFMLCQRELGAHVLAAALTRAIFPCDSVSDTDVTSGRPAPSVYYQ